MIERNLQFFIDAAKSLDKNDITDFVYKKLLEGIVSNPNITERQFLEVFSSIPAGEKYDYHKYGLFEYLTRNNLQKNKLGWAWDIAKKIDLNESVKPLYDSGTIILKTLEENDDLRLEVVEYFTSLEGKTAYSKVEKKQWPIFTYSILIETMMEMEKNMNKFDVLAQAFDNTRIIFGDGNNDWLLYSHLAANPHLDNARVSKYFNEIKKIPAEDERALAIKKLITQSNISGELFDDIFEYRRQIKYVTLWNHFYIGAAQNTAHIDRIFKFLRKYVKKLISAGGDRDKVFCSLISNPSLTDKQVDELINILKYEVLENTFLKHGSMYERMFDVFSSTLKRKGLGSERIEKILSIFFHYITHVETHTVIDNPLYWMNTKLDLSEMEMDNQIFDMIIENIMKSNFFINFSSHLLRNRNLTQKQYDNIAGFLDPLFFRNGTFNYSEIPVSIYYNPAYCLFNWASCKYVK